MTKPTFTLRQTNATHGKDNLYIIEVHEHADDAAREAALKEPFRYFDTHAEAVEKLEAQLREKKARLLRELETVQHNLDNAGTIYTMGPTLTPRFTASFDELVAQFEKLKEEPGTFEMHTMRVSNTYLNAGPALFVLQLPEYDTVVQSFTAALCDLVLRAMAAAGLTRSSDWNGLGLTTWSIRVVHTETEPA